MNERRGKLLGDLREPVFDERQSARLSGSQDITVRGLGEVLIELLFEHVVQMAEGFLFGNDGDVILAGVGDQFRYLRPA